MNALLCIAAWALSVACTDGDASLGGDGSADVEPLSEMLIPLQPGTGIGYKAYAMADTTRDFEPDRAGMQSRPIIVHSWFPVHVQRSGDTVLLGELASSDVLGAFGAGDQEEAITRFMDVVAAYPGVTEGQAEALSRDLLNEPTLSVHAEPDRSAQFRTVVFSNALGSSGHYLHAWCERLATEGYRAIVVDSRFDVLWNDLSHDAHAVNMQLKDMQVAIAALAHDSLGRPMPYALVAWSFGGLASALLAAHDRNAVALVSLDSGLGYAYGEEQIAQSWDSLLLTRPYLEFRPGKTGRLASSRQFYNERAQGPKQVVVIPELDHYHFSSLAVRIGIRATKQPALLIGQGNAMDTLVRYLGERKWVLASSR